MVNNSSLLFFSGQGSIRVPFADSVKRAGSSALLYSIYRLESGITDYYGAAEPPVRWWRSHLSGLSEPPRFAVAC